MNKTYQFRMYPTKKQETTLNKWLALCCQVYNAALQERRDAYRIAGKSLGFAHQCSELPGCKEVCPELAEVNAQSSSAWISLSSHFFEELIRARRSAILVSSLDFAIIA